LVPLRCETVSDQIALWTLATRHVTTDTTKQFTAFYEQHVQYNSFVKLE